MFRVAACAYTISAMATIQVTTMEFVIGRPNGRAISTALCGNADMLSPLHSTDRTASRELVSMHGLRKAASVVRW
jgi:hypothetical protein